MTSRKIHTAIVGAGAAGCFCAVLIKRRCPSATVEIFEAGHKPMAKLAITGGGRCNLTNTFRQVDNLSDAYPRGASLMKRALARFSNEDTCRWFEAEGVPLVAQSDECIFPASQDAMDIVRTLSRAMRQEGVAVRTDHRLISLARDGEGYKLVFGNGEEVSADTVVVTTGGSPRAEGIAFLEPLGLETVAPVPSLFSFKINDSALTEMAGAVVENAYASIPGTRFSGTGPLLVTHTGMSGPAILKLSSYAARHLAETSYQSPLSIDWLPGQSVEETLEQLKGNAVRSPQKKVTMIRPEQLTGRLWEHIVRKCGLREDIRWAELGKKGFNKLTARLHSDEYRIAGRAPHKEEFVTCGGVALSEISLHTLESKKHMGLYFAGEVLDIDAITGGFNLQAAWSTAFVAAESVTSRLI